MLVLLLQLPQNWWAVTNNPLRVSLPAVLSLLAPARVSGAHMSPLPHRWTRREQADFYRTVSSFGVIYDQEKKTFDWTQFRAISRLEKKTDESLEKYFYSFVAMCKNVCGLPLWKEDGK